MPLPRDASVSLAEAKLRRQTERNQQAEAVIAASGSSDSTRGRSRARTKSWKPFDHIGSTSEQDRRSHDKDDSDSGVAIEPGLLSNPIRHSLSRSMSSVSNHTDPPPTERHNSDSSDKGGFQVYTGRRRKRNRTPSQKKPSADKPAAVESGLDKREIYDTFGNALPGSEFIEMNTGTTDGQVQCIQHPNGDVSAHQWSTNRYVWENIGQFSSVRKRIEGQLAAERLRGETAFQNMHQHSLAYFRALAKQREAAITGLPFGQKEIQALLPGQCQRPLEPLIERHPLPNQTTAPSHTTHAQSLQVANATLLRPSSPSEATLQPRQAGLSIRSRQTRPWNPHATVYPTPTMQPQVSQHYPQPQFYGQSFLPFQALSPYSGQFNPLAYNGLPFTWSHWPGMNTHPPAASNPLSAARSVYPGMSDNMIARDAPQAGISVSSKKSTANSDWHKADLSPFTQIQDPIPTPNTVKSQEQAWLGADTRSGLPTPSREAMRDQLLKLGVTAKQRNVSHSTARRTVLFDPLVMRDEQDEEPSSSKVVGSADMQMQSKWLAHLTTLAASNIDASTRSELHESSVVSTSKNGRKDSVLQPSTHAGHRLSGFHSLDEFSQQYALLPPRSGPSHKALIPTHHSPPPNEKRKAKQDPDEELKEWFTGGDRTLRQEELYQRLRAASFADTPSPTTLSSPLTPPWNASTTRVLIPVYENLAAYVTGDDDPWTRWTAPPEWCIDRGPRGNDSFFDPPAIVNLVAVPRPLERMASESRYRPLPGELRFGRFGARNEAIRQTVYGLEGLT